MFLVVIAKSIALALALSSGEATISPCANDNDFRYPSPVEDKMLNCKQIRYRENRRALMCTFPEVATNCPQACGLCCEDVASYQFKLRNMDVFQSCTWILGNKNMEKIKRRHSIYCTYGEENLLYAWGNRTVRDACPVSCDFCFSPVPAILPSGPTTWQEDLETVLDELNSYLLSNSTFLDQMIFSLVTAQSNAKERLNPDLYNAFLLEGNGWPTTIPEYLAFLTRYAQWVPQQNDYDGWLAKPNQSYDESHQEVYDRLVHFYYLINQKLPNDGKTLQDDPWFSDWLVEYAKVWGKFCDSTESITPETIHSFWKLSKPFNITQSMIPINEEDIPGSINKYTIYNDKGQP